MITDIIIPASIIACCLMAWAVGANDLANSMTMGITGTNPPKNWE
jgi:phosphate/sulfate permease